MFIQGADLRKMRLEAGMTTVKMAELAGVKTRKTYENWEKNIGAPSMNQFIAMSTGCSFNPAVLVQSAVDRGEQPASLDLNSAALSS